MTARTTAAQATAAGAAGRPSGPDENERDPSLPGKNVTALAAALVTVTLWASAFVGIRAAMPDLSPGALALGRLLVASVVLGVVVLARPWEPAPRGRDLPGLLLCGVLWFALYNVALNEAELRVDAGTAAMLVNLGPLFIAVLAGVVLGEGFPRTLMTGGAIALAGASVIGLAISAAEPVGVVGALLCLVAAAAYAGGVVAQKPLLSRMSALRVTWLSCTIGAVACLPFLPALVDDLARASGASIAWMIYLGAMPTAVAFTTWAYALSRTTAGRMGATTYLVPPVAVVLAWLVLGEAPPPLALFGGALCLVGVMIARR